MDISHYYLYGAVVDPSLTLAIGPELRRVRTQLDLTAEQVARAARAFGVTWHRSTIPHIESGRRQLTIAEWLLLPSIVSGAALVADGSGHLLPHTDFLPEGWIFVTEEVQATREGIAEVMKGTTSPSEESGQWRFLRELEDVLPEEGDYIATDVERKVAIRLSRTPHEVAQAAISLWGRSIEEERDARLADREGAAGRGAKSQMTRQLTDEVRRSLAKEGK